MVAHLQVDFPVQTSLTLVFYIYLSIPYFPVYILTRILFMFEYTFFLHVNLFIFQRSFVPMKNGQKHCYASAVLSECQLHFSGTPEFPASSYYLAE